MFFGCQNVDGYQRMQNYPKILQNRTDRIKTHKSVVIADRNEVENAGRVEMWTGRSGRSADEKNGCPKRNLIELRGIV